MLEADFYGKLLPTHPDIMDILRDIRSEYDIPELLGNRHHREVATERLRDTSNQINPRATPRTP
jgi:hypothetical protein